MAHRGTGELMAQPTGPDLYAMTQWVVAILDDPDMLAAIERARTQAMQTFLHEFPHAPPGQSLGFWACACAAGLCDILSGGAGPIVAGLLADQLAGTPYQLVERNPN
jgi:hypothetical protein